ncbi:MAG: glycosyl hydrolase family 8 [Pseudomonadota bacterium]
MIIDRFVKILSRSMIAISIFTAVATTHAYSQTMHQSLAGNALWATYKSRFVSERGAVVDNVNNGISHSESQGYGMLLALAANDKEAFARIYRFAQSELSRRGDALFAWRYDPSKDNAVSDTNNASDGDLLIAWALLEAAAIGWNQSYEKSGMAILNDLKTQIKSFASLGLVLSPGEKGFENEDGTLVINPSYWIYPAFERLAVLTENRDWLRLSHTGEHIVAQFLAKPKQLIPDWASVTAKSTNVKFAEGKSSVFGYESIRVPLYLMMAGKTDKEQAFEILNRAAGNSSGKISRLNAESGKPEGVFNDHGYTAILQLAACLKDGTPIHSEYATRLDTNYYPATLQLLALATANRSNKKCL